MRDGRTIEELAVWSGDSVTLDEEGYLYFVSRIDEMIKTSGYRVSPTEIEESILALTYISEAVATGVPHPELGQAIIAIVTSTGENTDPENGIITELKKQLPAYMIPHQIHVRDEIPRNANGKFDRKRLYLEFENVFQK